MYIILTITISRLSGVCYVILGESDISALSERDMGLNIQKVLKMNSYIVDDKNEPLYQSLLKDIVDGFRSNHQENLPLLVSRTAYRKTTNNKSSPQMRSLDALNKINNNLQ